MAHPFAPMPTLEEFIEWAKGEGCNEIDLSHIKIVGPKGLAPIKALQSQSDNIAILPGVAPTDHLTPTVMASLCRQLKIGPHPLTTHLLE